jgi:hypothetical protein
VTRGRGADAAPGRSAAPDIFDAPADAASWAAV